MFLPLSRIIAVSANVIVDCTRLWIKFILSYLISSYGEHIRCRSHLIFTLLFQNEKLQKQNASAPDWFKTDLELECAASNGNRYPPYPQVYWMLSVSHLDTSACQIVGHFFQALCMQYTNPSPWMVRRTDERMKWQQYPSASMFAKGKSSGNICISNSMPFLPSDLSTNVQKPENVVNRPIDGQTDWQTDGQKSGRGHYCWGVLLWPPQLGLGGKCDKKWKLKNVEKITSFSDAVTLTFDLRHWKVNQVRTLSLPMCIPNLRTIHPVVF